MSIVAGFVKAHCDNLPKIDAISMFSFLGRNPDFTGAEIRGDKNQRHATSLVDEMDPCGKNLPHSKDGESAFLERELLESAFDQKSLCAKTIHISEENLDIEADFHSEGKQNTVFSNSLNKSCLDVQKKESNNDHQCVGGKIDMSYIEKNETNAEDGEIHDTSNMENLNKYSCRFYQKGKCAFGRNCRFLHLSDKGLYCMFDSTVSSDSVQRQVNMLKLDCSFQPIFGQTEEELETSWDRALREAIARVREWESKKQKYPHLERLYMAIKKEDEIDNKLLYLGSPWKARGPASKSPEHEASYRKSSRARSKVKESRLTEAVAPPESTRNDDMSKTSFELQDHSIRSKIFSKRKHWMSRSGLDYSHSTSQNYSSHSTGDQCRKPSLKRSRCVTSPVRTARKSPSTSYISSSPSSSSKEESRHKKGKGRYRRFVSRAAISRCNPDEIDFNRRSRRPPFRPTYKFNRDSSPDVISKKNTGLSLGELLNVHRSLNLPDCSEVKKLKYPSTKSSDMSISPTSDHRVSDASNRRSDQSKNRPAFDSSSKRCPSDMSISSLSDDVSRSPDVRSLPVYPEVLKPGVEKLGVKEIDIIPGAKHDVNEKSTKSGFTGALCADSEVPLSVPKIGMRVKKEVDPLMMDLMKYHGIFTKSHRKGTSALSSKLSATATVKKRETGMCIRHKINKIVVENQLVKKESRNSDEIEFLLKRLQEIDAAIKRKRTAARYKL